MSRKPVKKSAYNPQTLESMKKMIQKENDLFCYVIFNKMPTIPTSDVQELLFLAFEYDQTATVGRLIDKHNGKLDHRTAQKFMNQMDKLSTAKNNLSSSEIVEEIRRKQTMIDYLNRFII